MAARHQTSEIPLRPRAGTSTPQAQQRDDVQLAKAHVQWWKWRVKYGLVWVRCPFCDEIHRHKFGEEPIYTIQFRRLARCNIPPPIGENKYVVCFPFDDAQREAWYAIDKERALFVTAGADPVLYFHRHIAKDRLLNSFEEKLQGKRRWNEARRPLGTQPDDVARNFTFALSNVVMGRIDQVQDYLDNSEYREFLLHGIETQNPIWKIEGQPEQMEERLTGQTVLHLAAGEASHQMVALLLDKGADPNAQDAEGRTPLVEAALWGRLENVRLLLGSGADPELSCVRGRHILKAVDFARPSRSMREERHEHSGHQTDVFQRDRDREAIVRLLGGNPTPGRGGTMRLWGFEYVSNPAQPDFVTLVAHFNRPTKWKTVGVMTSGRMPPVAAMSGWSHNDDEMRIGGEVWTDAALQLCNDIGFPLLESPRDRGIPGRYHACHAERQLIAYFVKHHTFFDLLMARGRAMQNPRVYVQETMAELQRGTQVRLEPLPLSMPSLSNLWNIMPPVRVESARIMVCNPVCQDCTDFVQHVNDAMGLNIQVSYSAGI